VNDVSEKKWHVLKILCSTAQMFKAFNEVLDDMTYSDRSRYSASTYTLPYGRAYVSGWSPRMQRSDVPPSTTIHDLGAGMARSITYQPVNYAGAEHNTYDAIKARCLAANSLWEDPDFPAQKDSLFYAKPPSAWPNIQWKRPKVRRNIAEHAKLSDMKYNI
jgi:hypothetical protein